MGGTVLPTVFSADTDDAAFSTLYFDGGKTGQLSVYWSDESYRKMTTRVNIWGTAGRIFADRQECQVYLRDTATIPDGYEQGWNVRYTTELTEPVWFYLRGEEYSAQVESLRRPGPGRRAGRAQRLRRRGRDRPHDRDDGHRRRPGAPRPAPAKPGSPPRSGRQALLPPRRRKKPA